MKRILFFIFVIFTQFIFAEDILIGTNSISKTPLDSAIIKKIPIPMIKDGFTPQGLAYANNHIYLSGYISGEDWSLHRCHIFDIDTITGNYGGPVIIDNDCKHSGGLSIMPNGKLLITDLNWLFIVDINSIDWNNHENYQTNALIKKIRASDSIKGGMTTGSDKYGVWITRYNKNNTERADYFSWDALLSTTTLTQDMAKNSISVPAEVQGIGVDKNGMLWISTSTGDKNAKLYLINPMKKEQTQVYSAVSSIQDIDIDQNGNIWASSESASTQWKIKTFFPYIFEIVPDKMVNLIEHE